MAEKELEKILGSDNVLDSPSILDAYSRDLSYASPTMPRCIVKPGDAREVQEVVSWANDTRTPLVPMSSGPPHFRGDTVPGTEGAVIVDMSRMDRIIRIDARNKLAMVEPGVTFGQLQSELVKEGLCAYMPLVPRATKSVMGSVLEREPIIRPSLHWDSTDPLLCAEVIFGTGDRFRTGEASGPDTVEEQWEMDRVQMNPFGHSHIDFQRLISGAQGTMGIVTWITLKCGTLSTVKRALLVPSSGIQPLIDLSYQFTRYRFGGILIIVNGLNLACLLGNDPDEIEGLRNALPTWVLFASFEGYGILPEDKVTYEEADFREMAQACCLKPEEDISGAKAEDVWQCLSHPSPDPYWKMRFRGSFQDLFFLTTLDKTPGFVSAMPDLARNSGYPVENMGVYIQSIVQGTSCHCEFSLYNDPDNPGEKVATQRLVRTASKVFAEKGGFFSRPYVAWKEAAYFRAAGTQNMQRKIKKIFDPNGILNPGKLCF